MARDTLLEIVNKVALDLRFPTTSQVIGNSDKNVQTILSAVKDVAETDVFRAHAWACLSQPFTITFDGITEYWPLPDDFDYIINGTDWSIKDSVPAGGGLGPVEFQALRYANLSSPLRNMNWTQVGHNFDAAGQDPIGVKKALLFHPSPQAPLYEDRNGVPVSVPAFSCFYVSNYYVLDGVQFFAKEKLTQDSDTYLFDTEMVSQGTLIKMLKTLGRPFQAQQETFQEILDDRRRKDSAMANIHTEGRGNAPYPNTPGYVPSSYNRRFVG